MWKEIISPAHSAKIKKRMQHTFSLVAAKFCHFGGRDTGRSISAKSKTALPPACVWEGYWHQIRFQKWQCWWISLTWSIWQHRNRIVFANDSFNASKLLEDAIFLCWTWLRNLDKGFDIPFHHWSSNMREAFSD